MEPYSGRVSEVQLRRALRAERNVRLAVVFGSVATGAATPESDMDLLVSLREEGYAPKVRLERRLAAAVGRQVQGVSLTEALADPSLLADVLEDGRVLVDRDGAWPQLKAREAEIARDAARADTELSRRAADAVAHLRTSA